MIAKDTTNRTPPGPAAPDSADHIPPGKQPWQEPKLTVVEPRLVKHGRLQDITGQQAFLGGFSP
jgi:hypothetical protein